MGLKDLLPAWLVGVKPGPLSHFKVSALALAYHYDSSDEKLHLVAAPNDEGDFDIPVIKGRWPLIQKVFVVQDLEDRDVVCVDVETDRHPCDNTVTYYADPGEILIVATATEGRRSAK
jgi:hypothetical protein